MSVPRTLTTAWRLFGAVALSAAALSPASVAADQSGKLFAVVIGISEYPALPPEASLPEARKEASQLALQLREEAGYADVRLFTDASATRESITAALRDDLGNRVGYDDTLLFYFVGQGIGRDFDDPYLLTYETDINDLPGSAWAASELGATLKELVPAGNFIIVTDASHAGSLNGLPLLGPTADSWPDMGPSSYLLSATQPSRPAAKGAFGGHFLDAITGGADFSDDGVVDASELQRYLVLTLPDATGNAQYPSDAGRHDGTLAMSKDVLFKSTLPAHLDPTRAPPPPPSSEADVLGFTVDKAKFVIRDAFDPTVTCRGMEAKACENQCYVWDVPAGTCEVSAYVGSRRVTGKAMVVARGAYVCEPEGDTLRCVSPR